MESMTFKPEKTETVKRRLSLVGEFAERYRADPELRSRIDGGDRKDLLPDIGLSIPPGAEVRVVVNTEEAFHVVLPPDPNVELADEALSAVAGGKSAGSAGTTSTASTAGTVCGSFSSAASASTVGSAGSKSL